jgi:endonuclease-3
MTKKERYDAFVTWFSQNMPEPETELRYRNPYELLIAVVLSAQCTDKRVNIVTEKLFEVFPSPDLLAASHFDEVFGLIRSISYPNNKAKHLLGLAHMLVHDFGGEVPLKIEELQKLPGVGRKTANVIVSVLDQQPAMAVDTHVFRVSKRLGLVTQTAKTPLEVEKQLVKNIEKSFIHKAHHWLILHGRYTCVARNPKCSICQIQHFCRFYEKQAKA